MASSRVILGVLLAVGIGLLVLSVVWHNMLEGVLENKMRQNIQLSEDKRVFQTWKKTPIPIYTEYYLFNVTNPDDVIKNRSLPILKEVGPYTYRQSREKVNLSFSDDEFDLVSYYLKRTYVFDPELSAGTEDDLLTVLNIPLAAIANRAKSMTGMEKFGLNFFIGMHKAKPYITKSVSEMLFQGYKDKMVDAIQKAKKQVFLPNATFALFYKQNESLGEMYTVHRGRKDNTKYSTIAAYNGSSMLPFWAGDTCNMVNGTDGGQYPPFVNKDDKLYLFISDICRSGYLKYVGDSEYEGIPTYRYRIPFDMMAGPDANKDNQCFCTADPCMGSGVLDLGPCKKGAPIVVSQPHFFNTDPPLQNYVEGLNPNQELHDTYLDVDPVTGAVVNVQRKLQINIKVQKIDGISYYKDFNNFILPVVWVNENARLTPELVDKYKEAVMRPLHMLRMSVYLLYGISALVLIGAILYAIVLVCRRKSPLQLNGNSSVRQSDIKSQQNFMAQKL